MKNNYSFMHSGKIVCPNIETKSVGKLPNQVFYHDISHIDFFSIPGAKSFSLTTTYPGLIIGSGYFHPKRKDHNSDYQAGFFFDHTSGMPVIPGSTIKGVLKSVFPKSDKNSVGSEFVKIDEEKFAYINQIVEDVQDSNNDIITFDRQSINKTFFNQSNIFFDAFISNYPKTEKDKSEIFEDDYITPHTNGRFGEPNPIRILKIRPGVTFTFQFKLSQDIVESKIVLDVFKKIITDYGLGAKRNVGYGYFTK